jgi:DNA-binding beta-propeller fold protein YncE
MTTRPVALLAREWSVITFSLFVLLVVSSTVSLAADPGWLGPIDVVASPDQNLLFVLEQDASQIAVLDTASREIIRTIACPEKPSGLALSSDGATLYVTGGGVKGMLVAIDAMSGEVSKSIPVGHTPCAPVLLPDQKRAFVCNRFDNNVAVVDLDSGQVQQRVSVLREPVSAAATPDGSMVLVTNLLPVDPSDADDVAAEVSLIETQGLSTSTVRLPNGSSSVYGVTVAPNGEYAYVVHVLSRYQMPTTQLERGWMNTNAMSIINLKEKKLLNTVLLDDLDRGAANPWDVETTDDGKTIVVSHAGTHEISVIDAEGLIQKILQLAKGEQASEEADSAYGTGYRTTFEGIPNDLTFLVDLRRRIKLQRGTALDVIRGRGEKLAGPRGLAIIGAKVYVAAYFCDVVAEVDLEDQSYVPVTAIALGPAPKTTVERQGELYFHDADFCFQHWQSCSSCHPSARVDGLNWDLMNDDMGNPKNAKSMLLAHETPPSMISGVRGTAEDAVRAGLEHIQFAVRPEEDAEAIDAYLKALKPVPSPHLVDGQMSESAQRGQALFFSEKVGCAECHPKPYYTDLGMHDLNYKGKYIRRTTFDTPTLIEVWRTAPYLHDGHFTTVFDLLKTGKHGLSDEAGASLSDQDLNDLVEFVLSL